MNRSRGDLALAIVTGAAAAIVLSSLAMLVSLLVVRGGGHLSPRFLFEGPGADLATGGIFPAVYGTTILTLLMTVAVVPLGVATAVYLVEYAPRSSRAAWLVRVAVHNLAGVPSIVFGLFGLGFFVLFAGGTLDAVFYDSRPVFARPCVLWSALTLALLTLPVVIVATEEALRAVPADMRHAALALGATRLEVVVRIALPQARGGILTGVILAVARGAGEVAPLLFVGAANYLPYLPVDLRDMFMHLGYHAYVLATQTPDAEGTIDAVYGTVLVLLGLTLALNGAAMILRAKARR